jgi:microcystin-dependent protein
MAQLQKGTTYTGTGVSSFVTHTNLNAHVDNARIVGGAIDEQIANPSSTDSDLFLVNKGGDLFKQTKLQITETINSETISVNTLNAQDTISDTIVCDDISGVFGTLDDSGIILAEGKTVSIGGVNLSSGFVPTGAVMPFAMVIAPAGWVRCDGETYDATPTVVDGVSTPSIYANLFTAIGTLYGGTGAGSFKVPDLRAEFIRGYDYGAGTDPRPFGSKQGDLLEKHKHVSSNNDCRSYLGINGVASTGTYNGWCDTSGVGYSGASLTGDGSHGTETFNSTTSNSNDVVGNETRPRNVALNYCIKL